MSGLRFAFHSFAAVHFAFSCLYDWHYVHLPQEMERFKGNFDVGKFKFLTFWDAILQCVFFTICAMADVVSGAEKDHPLRKLQNTIMTSLAYPLAMFVGITFWLLYVIDRELVFPRSLDEFFPVWLNHCMHTNIMIFVLIEMYTNQYNYPPRSTGLKQLITFMLFYLIWIHVINFKTNVWVYPVLEVLSLPGRIGFFVGLLAIAVVLYISGEIVNEKLGSGWRYAVAPEPEIEEPAPLPEKRTEDADAKVRNQSDQNSQQSDLDRSCTAGTGITSSSPLAMEEEPSIPTATATTSEELRYLR